MKCTFKHPIVILALIILIQSALSVKHRKKQFPVQRPRVIILAKNL